VRSPSVPPPAIIALFLVIAACSQSVAAREEVRVRAGYHGAIAYHPESGSIGWATDRRTDREARVEALRQCGHERCEVVAAVTRGCVALARTGKTHVVQKGATRQEAEAKALRRCGARCEIAAWTCTR